MDLASKIDHTLLSPEANEASINRLCDEAVQYGFYAVCIPPYFVRHALTHLGESNVKVATVVGFPMGYNAIPAKVEEARKAIDEGAHEIDMVMNSLAFKAGDLNHVRNEIQSVATLTQMRGGKIKVILETSLLQPEDIKLACQILNEIKVDFAKTNTGYGSRGVTIEDVQYMREYLNPEIKIKASGGIRDKQFALDLLAAGADRIGASASVQLLS